MDSLLFDEGYIDTTYDVRTQLLEFLTEKEYEVKFGVILDNKVIYGQTVWENQDVDFMELINTAKYLKYDQFSPTDPGTVYCLSINKMKNTCNKFESLSKKVLPGKRCAYSRCYFPKQATRL